MQGPRPTPRYQWRMEPDVETFDTEPRIKQMSAETQALIDTMSYEELLRHWRWDPIGHYLFMGEAGPYFSKIMARRRLEVGDNAAAQASLIVGW